MQDDLSEMEKRLAERAEQAEKLVKDLEADQAT